MNTCLLVKLTNLHRFRVNHFESLWITLSHYESLWVTTCHYELLWVTWVIMSHYEHYESHESLCVTWVIMSHDEFHESLWVIMSHMSHYESLCAWWVIMSHYESHKSLWVTWVTMSHMSHYGSLCALCVIMSHYESLWVILSHSRDSIFCECESTRRRIFSEFAYKLRKCIASAPFISVFSSARLPWSQTYIVALTLCRPAVSSGGTYE